MKNVVMMGADNYDNEESYEVGAIRTFKYNY